MTFEYAPIGGSNPTATGSQSRREFTVGDRDDQGTDGGDQPDLGIIRGSTPRITH